MAKKKLRQINVDGLIYYWRFRPGYQHTGNLTEPYQCRDYLVVFLARYKRSPLQIDFFTWEDAIIGGPLRTGVPLLIDDNNSPGININEPGWVAKIIRKARQYGWQPEQTSKPWCITAGVDFLLKL